MDKYRLTQVGRALKEYWAGPARVDHLFQPLLCTPAGLIVLSWGGCGASSSRLDAGSVGELLKPAGVL
jgi:hypothetical protein